MTSLGDADLSDILHCIPTPAPNAGEKSEENGFGRAPQSGSLGSRRFGSGSSAATATAATLANNIHQNSRRNIGRLSVGISRLLLIASFSIVEWC